MAQRTITVITFHAEAGVPGNAIPVAGSQEEAVAAVVDFKARGGDVLRLETTDGKGRGYAHVWRDAVEQVVMVGTATFDDDPSRLPAGSRIIQAGPGEFAPELA